MDLGSKVAEAAGGRWPGRLRAFLVARYFLATTGHPALTLAVAVLAVVLLGLGVPRLQVDASAESLVSRDNPGLQYYRSISARYGSGAVLILAYTPHGDLFDPDELARIERLRDELDALGAVASVTSLLDVPLLESPPVTLAELQREPHTLLSPETDLALARKELTESPLYGNLLVGEEGRTAALHLRLQEDSRLQALLRERDALLEARLERALSRAETGRLEALSDAVHDRQAELADELQENVAQIRRIAARYEDGARIDLAGAPLIVSDMIRFVWRDMRVFGSAVMAFVVVLLAVVFRRLRWVLLTAAICIAAGVCMAGYLGWTEWRPTVVSSNFLPVLLVITLSLVVHLIVRYEELHHARPTAGQGELVTATVRSKFAPSCYTALTTMVAFGSLAVSGIEPVIEFGWMMMVGIAFAFVLTFVVFPAALALLPSGTPRARGRDAAGRLVTAAATLIEGRTRATLAVGVAAVALAAAGMARLGVEHRFIDYFDESTEIYQGMLTLDRRLGGTTPFDVVLDPDPEYLAAHAAGEPGGAEDTVSGLGGGAGITGTSYWFNMFRLDTVKAVHRYLEGLSETGKVLSPATGIEMLERLNQGRPLDDFTLSIIYGRLPEAVRSVLIDPYLSAGGDQVRFAVRVFESDPDLQRDVLLDRVRTELGDRFGLAPEQIHLTGLMVLYNDVLQSLFRSQAVTVGLVFVAIAVMFWALFRSLRVAALAILPNMAVAAMVLGVMGWLGISLDIMTITIAAIVLGIAVDDTIHYTHRYLGERRAGADHRTAVRRSHAGVGRAMLYTTVTIALGFAVFALSAFVPIIYFGLLTGLAVVVALLADLTLLPALLAGARPGRRR